MTPAELVAAACPTIANQGAAFYFIPETTGRGKEHGLDGFRLYVLGRGGVLGDTSAVVVASAFGYFNPTMITKLWDSGSEKLSPSAAAALYWGACADLGRAKLGDVDGLDALVDALGVVNDAADPAGLALYAGIRQMPLVEDAPGRAMQLIATLRELRGSAHLVALRAVGLDHTHAHFIKRPDMVEGFGWTASDAERATDEERTLLDQAEEITDRIVTPAYAALDEGGQQALLHGLDGVGNALAPAG